MGEEKGEKGDGDGEDGEDEVPDELKQDSVDEEGDGRRHVRRKKAANVSLSLSLSLSLSPFVIFDKFYFWVRNVFLLLGGFSSSDWVIAFFLPSFPLPPLSSLFLSHLPFLSLSHAHSRVDALPPYVLCAVYVLCVCLFCRKDMGRALLTTTSINVLRYMGKYLHMMRILQPISFQGREERERERETERRDERCEQQFSFDDD